MSFCAMAMVAEMNAVIAPMYAMNINASAVIITNVRETR